MRKVTTLFTVTTLGILLGGCASTPSQLAYYDNVDYQKVELVNRWASRNNVQVVWVNYPQKPSVMRQ